MEKYEPMLKKAFVEPELIILNAATLAGLEVREQFKKEVERSILGGKTLLVYIAGELNGENLGIGTDSACSLAMLMSAAATVRSSQFKLLMVV